MRRQHIQDPGIQTTHDAPGNSFIEGENDNLESSLKGKVKALKSLSIDIGTEIRTQNTFLDEMDSDFEGSTGLLQKTMHRLKGITKEGHWKIWLYLFLFTLFVFGVCWLVVRTR
ncbi:BET1 homolog [Octopus vulgaris]|uniref:BET1 homolog n=2 Tax=Octopus TaxID=6643 RepID=A0AA36F9L6_OCTVU|nr:BET1 homolog [Octopus sinensis]CAI9729620.1 BET1 homolog [Octopus vulgaris]